MTFESAAVIEHHNGLNSPDISTHAPHFASHLSLLHHMTSVLLISLSLGCNVQLICMLSESEYLASGWS